jgi:predicted Na+-dependent transporter
MVLLPSAVSSPTFSLIFNGNITMSVFLVVFTNILTPLCIPLMCHYVLAGTQEFDGVRMFQSLFYTVFLPLVLHLPFRKSRSFSRLVVKHNSLITVVSLAFIFILAVARYKTDLISHISLIPQYIGISFLVFFFLYFVGWFMGGRTTIANKITFSISSGANNIGLGVTLTILYFSAEVNVYFITAQFTWTLILVILRPFLRSMIGFFSPKTPRAVVGSKP